MDELPNQQTPRQTRRTFEPKSPQAVRVIHISVQPKTWFGKIIAGIVGVAAMLVAFFLSILAFAIIASIVIVAIIYFLWAMRRARRTLRDRTIDVTPEPSPSASAEPGASSDGR